MVWTLRSVGASERLICLLERPERQLDVKGTILKRSAAVLVWADDGFVLKRWRVHGFGSVLKSVFRASHAKRAFVKACRLASAGVPTPQPFATADRTYFGAPLVSYFVMEGIVGAADLAVWQASGREAMQETARLLTRLHAAGFTHRDLKPTNILFDATGRAYLIDLDGVRSRGRVSDDHAAADLTKLARRMVELASLSPREAAVFLREYCRQSGKGSRRPWWRRLRNRLARYHIPSVRHPSRAAR